MPVRNDWPGFRSFSNASVRQCWPHLLGLLGFFLVTIIVTQFDIFITIVTPVFIKVFKIILVKFKIVIVIFFLSFVEEKLLDKARRNEADSSGSNPLLNDAD
jgi:hypothetical protein